MLKKRKTIGSDILSNPLVIILLLFLAVGIGYLFVIGGFKVAAALIMLPIILIYLNRFFNSPRIGIYSIIIAAFVAIGLTRYIPGVPLGLSIDGLLVLTYIAVFFKHYYNKISIKPILNDLTLLAFIWFLYSLAEFFNPEALSRQAWFYAMRGMSLYMLLIIPLIFLIFNKVKFLYIFLYYWAIWSILITLKGMQQMFLGPDFAEQRWLNEGGAITHIIFGQLRVFSFLSDAGQFGATQGVAMVVGIILALRLKGLFNKVLFWSMGLAGFYGMMISGTRGAIIIPGVGFIFYLAHTKNFRAIIIGLFLIASAFIFFKYTYIGQSNAQIRRMRTAFRPEDNASLQVRLQTKMILKEYMATRPFGGGIGSAGNWGKRFSPYGFLANIATDSWYVQIWAEQGIIGLFLHLFIIFYILLKGNYYVMFRLEDEEIKVFGQMPSGIMVYISMALIWLSPWLDDEMIYIKKNNLKIFDYKNFFIK